MSRQRGGSGALVICVALLRAVSAHAVEVTIDDFLEATNTQIIPLVQLIAHATGDHTTGTDSGLTGTVGGVRKLTVTATLVTGMSENVTSGVDTGGGLCYNSSNNADGQDELVYDRGGLGLQNLNLSHAQGIQVRVFSASPSSIPYSVKVTLVDASGNSASKGLTSSQVCSGSPECDPLLFPFTDFAVVNLRRIVRITILIDPSKAADIFFDAIRTYGTPDTELICDDHEDNDNNGLIDCADPACAHALNCINTVPLLSPGMIGGLIAMLGVAGLVGLTRTGWSR
jgi:hypothetical protein